MQPMAILLVSLTLLSGGVASLGAQAATLRQDPDACVFECDTTGDALGLSDGPEHFVTPPPSKADSLFDTPVLSTPVGNASTGTGRLFDTGPEAPKPGHLFDEAPLRVFPSFHE